MCPHCEGVKGFPQDFTTVDCEICDATGEHDGEDCYQCEGESQYTFCCFCLSIVEGGGK
jgi:hypothetical protein